jgi:hypothetical protein
MTSSWMPTVKLALGLGFFRSSNTALHHRRGEFLGAETVAAADHARERGRADRPALAQGGVITSR